MLILYPEIELKEQIGEDASSQLEKENNKKKDGDDGGAMGTGSQSWCE